MLICRFYTRIISDRIDTGGDLPGKIRDHLGRCPRCREYYSAAIRMTEQLAEEAAGEKIAPSPFLLGRIMASLEETNPRPVRWKVRFSWSAAVLLAVLVVSTMYVRHRPAFERRDGADSAGLPTGLGASGFFAAAQQWPAEEKILEWSRKLDQPLETELQSVIHDAQAAIGTLAHNFLPEGLIAQ